jgi:hypothetical protein
VSISEEKAAMMGRLKTALISQASAHITKRKQKRAAQSAVALAFDLLWGDRLLTEPTDEDVADYRRTTSQAMQTLSALCGPMRFRQMTDPRLVSWPSKKQEKRTIAFGLRDEAAS